MATCVVFDFIEFITCSDEGKPWTGRITNLFRAVKSTTNRSFPLFFGTNCEGAQYLLDSSTPTLLIIPCFSSLSISVRTFCLMLAGMGLGLCMYSQLFHISRVSERRILMGFVCRNLYGDRLSLKTSRFSDLSIASPPL